MKVIYRKTVRPVAADRSQVYQSKLRIVVKPLCMAKITINEEMSIPKLTYHETTAL